jgi:beta-carotene hydroxylase
MPDTPMQADLSDLNRQAIEAAREHTGQLAWPTILLAAAVLTAFVVHLALFAAGVLPLWAAIPVYAALTYLSYTPLHEAAHGNIHGGDERLQWLNDLCGYLVAPLIMIPFSTHRVEHFTHHRYTNQPEQDPDYMVSGMRTGFVAFVVTGFKFLWMQNTFLFRSYWATASLRERAMWWAEVAFSAGWRIAFVALVARESALTLLVVGYLIGAFFTVYWFAYRPHYPYEDATRYRNTSSLIVPFWMKPIEWFWLGQTLHSIHHLFPRVPFYRYHALHRRIEPILRAHGTPIVGMFSRSPVPERREPSGLAA